jgi:hypothetical protein
VKADILMSGLFVATGIYGLSLAYFWPQKLGLSPRMPPWVFKLICFLMILSGLLIALLSIPSSGH